jgi:hypothetical protein
LNTNDVTVRSTIGFRGRDDLKKPLFAVATFGDKKARPNSAEVLLD